MASARREESVRVWCEQRTLLCAYSHRPHSSESCYKPWPSPCTPHKRLPQTCLPTARVSPPSHPCLAHHPSFCFKLIRQSRTLDLPAFTFLILLTSHPHPDSNCACPAPRRPKAVGLPCLFYMTYTPPILPLAFHPAPLHPASPTPPLSTLPTLHTSYPPYQTPPSCTPQLSPHLLHTSLPQIPFSSFHPHIPCAERRTSLTLHSSTEKRRASKTSLHLAASSAHAPLLCPPGR